MHSKFAWVLCFFTSTAIAQQTGALSIVSGNGQVTLEQFRTTLPLTVVARDTAGRPLAGVPVQWSLPAAQGTLTGTISTTDANGQASTYFLSTDIQPGTSWLTVPVTAQSSVGSATFYVTTTPRRTGAGTQAELPLVELLTPTLENRIITGRANSVVAGAVQVRVTAQAGVSQGMPVPNVGVRLVLVDESAATATASCNTPDGVVLTNSQGIATCDVRLGPVVGTAQLAASVGEYRTTPTFSVQVTPGAACTYTLSATSQLFAATGGAGSVNVNTQSGCAWTAASNAPWINIASGASATGSGAVTYTVASNSATGRVGAMTIAGQTFTVTQNAAVSGGLSILTGAVPVATVGLPYNLTFEAAGGTPPYRWSTASTLPAGMSLLTNGNLSGTTTAVGNFPLTITATDAANNSISRSYTLSVINATAAPTITITSLPGGTIAAPYQQAISVSGGCSSPFSQQPSLSVAVGNLPPGLQLSQVPGVGWAISGTPTANGNFAFTLRAADSCGRTSTRELSITISGSSPSQQLTLTPTSLSFTLPQGSNRALAENLVISSPTPVEFRATATTEQGGQWLIINGVNSGTTNATISVGAVNAQDLPGGTYRGTITITSSVGTATLPVTLNITATPTISSTLNTVIFDLRAGEVGNQSVRVNSTGPARLTVTKFGDSAWLSVNPATFDAPGNINLTASALNLAPGSYFASLLVEGPANNLIIPVTLVVRARPQILVQPSSLTLRYRLGSTTTPREEFALSSSGEAFGFTIASAVSVGNWLIASPQRGTTPSRIAVSAEPAGLAPGTYSGQVTILSLDPSVPAVVVPVALLVENIVPRVTAVVNAASYQGGAVAPGQYVTLFGESLGPAALTAGRLVGDRLDTQAGGVRVLIDGIAAPVVYASAGQTAIIIPYSIAGRTSAQLVVEYSGERSAPLPVNIAETAPGIFLQFDGQYGAILNQNGSVNSTSNPAAAESIVSLFATGEGQTTPAGLDGVIATADRLPTPVASVKVFIDGREAEILYAGAAPGAPAGALQVNARVPANVRGSVPVTLQIGERASRSVLIAVTP